MTTASHFSLLVIDDEPDLRTLYELTLLREGYDLDTAGTVQEALLHLKDRTYSAVITDMRLPDGTGLDVLKWLEESGRREKAIVITAYGSSENAVDALKAGAYDYLTKPVDLKQFRGVVASALGRGGSGAPTVDPTSLPSEHRIAAPPRPPRAAAPAPAAPVSAALARMAGQSMAMQNVRELVEKVARSMAPVLVAGESGTGKELVARAIHEVSARGAMPFVPVNCSAIPENLLEAEFFGYRKGAFTGANDDREGFFQ
ncbi:MAG: sigma 54-interacting transcriptional regulator, partial [Caldimonas sp.]